MKDRIRATLDLIAEAKESLVRSEILLKNIQFLTDNPPPRFPPPDTAPIPPDPALHDEPPSRDP